MADTSIPALKRAFLQSQVRILSAPLEPTEDWREQAGDVPEEGDLEDRSVDAVLNKVNTLLRQHNNAAFPAPALAHVAAQIDALYWATSEPLAGGGVAASILQDGEIDRKADLTADEIIASLPEEWPEEELDSDEEQDEAEAAQEEQEREQEQLQPTTSSSSTSRKRKSTASRRPSGLEAFAEGARYKQLHDRLVALQEERARARARLVQATKLRDMLAPLTEDPAANVQPNLVTRDGELGRELERMVVLGARVGGKLK